MRHRQAGFTLLELIVVMALMGIVFFFAIRVLKGLSSSMMPSRAPDG